MWRAVLSARNQDGVNGSLRGAGVQRGGASGASLACRERRSSPAKYRSPVVTE